MIIDAPLALHRERVRPEWTDYNGHMNMAYYVLAFDHATDAFFDWLGLGEAHVLRSGGTTFTAEAHVSYAREVAADAPLGFTTQLLGYDQKRMHYFHHMNHGDEGFLAATNELLSLHVDLATRRVAPMPSEILTRLSEVMEAHADLPTPEAAGRVIRLPPRQAV